MNTYYYNIQQDSPSHQSTRALATHDQSTYKDDLHKLTDQVLQGRDQSICDPYNVLKTSRHSKEDVELFN